MDSDKDDALLDLIKLWWSRIHNRFDHPRQVKVYDRVTVMVNGVEMVEIKDDVSSKPG